MGDPTLVGTSADFRCWLWQNQTRDDTVNQDIQFEQWDLAIEPDAINYLDGSSRVTIDAVAYEAFGPPWEVFNPRTRVVTHLQATLRRTS